MNKESNISHPDKVLYRESGLTKGDVAEYYGRMTDRILPCLENRILSTIRCPEGIDGPCFYKKHPAGETNMATIQVSGSRGGKEEYYYITDAAGLHAHLLGRAGYRCAAGHQNGGRDQTAG